MVKLGRDTGSLVNYVHMTSKQPEPTVGMGATLLFWSDRHAATVTSVFKIGKCLAVGVKQDNAKRTDNRGFCENQDYEYTPNPDAQEQYFKLNNNRWVQVRKNAETGRWKQTDGCGLRLGERDEHYDFTF